MLSGSGLEGSQRPGEIVPMGEILEAHAGFCRVLDPSVRYAPTRKGL
jgi:hypothetical protein